MELEPFSVHEHLGMILREPFHVAGFGMDMSEALEPSFKSLSPLAAYEADSLSGMGDVFAVDFDDVGMIVTLYTGGDIDQRIRMARAGVEGAFAAQATAGHFAEIVERLPDEIETGEPISGARLRWRFNWLIE